ncbi:MAG: hypothetical protein KKH74_06335 [Gammaproteobacteria bacterium]|nr:hypothetical protein [Gammaproteobacteria bacterium]MBU1732261.1 hypothetical protein [Gammaproteobacteria bacterium]MBU1893831.1 hypothetical protein [Gammaproteobacteria bacterium]
MYLPRLTDDELIRYANSTHDTLTGTDLECELLKRFVALIADTEGEGKFINVLDDFDYTDAEDLRADLYLAAAVREAVNNNPYQSIDN